MTGIEKIRAYVKRLQKTEGYGDYWKGYDSALNDILSFIDSLQEEPVSDDLEKAVTNFLMHTPLGDYHIRTSAFKAGANWQKQQMFDKFNEWCQEELYIHPHDCHVVQYVSDKALEDVDDFVEEFKKTINSKL